MHGPRHPIIRSVVSLSFVFAGLLTASNTTAAVKVTNVLGASKFTFGASSATPGATPAPSTGNPTIYAGTAGVTMGSTVNASPDQKPFDTCKLATASNPLVACNTSAIDGSVILTLQYTSDKEGYPILIDPNLSGVRVTPYGNVQRFAANSTGSISFRWSEICSKMNGTTGATVGTSCEVSSAAAVTHAFQLGVSSSDPNATTSDDTSPATVTIIASTYIGQDTNGASISEACSFPGAGLCHFAIANGDSKVVLKYLQSDPQTFPTGGPLDIEFIRVLWSEPQGSRDDAFSSFTTITSANPDNRRTDLRVLRSAANNIDLDPARVTGLLNDKFYAFKVAVVDLAGNTGYFTANGPADTNCEKTPNPSDQYCHIGNPGEVVGVLSEPIQCYIATAAYGSAMAPQVETFRQFRNQFLMPLEWGSRLVKFYYQHSPHYARMIAGSETLRTLARLSLWPALGFAWLSLHLGLEAALVISLVALAACAFGLLTSIRAVRNFRRRTKCPAGL